jgi:hypothetical protein
LFAFVASFLMLTVTSAIAQSFGTAEEARAMLDRAVAALKSDEAKALREFNDADNKEFHDRDLYVFAHSWWTSLSNPLLYAINPQML